MSGVDWRTVLKPTEAERIAVLDRDIDTARTADRALTAEREIIRRRCVARLIAQKKRADTND